MVDLTEKDKNLKKRFEEKSNLKKLYNTKVNFNNEQIELIREYCKKNWMTESQFIKIAIAEKINNELLLR